MLTYKGKFNSANVMIDEIDETTVTQIYNFLNNPAFENTTIVIMPDCHAGAGAVIGYTAKLNNFIIPNLIGVDIGCGIESFNLGPQEVDFAKLDEFVRLRIPSGFETRTDKLNLPQELLTQVAALAKKMKSEERLDRYVKSIGTLGGGNHFIELDKDPAGNVWLTIHSGSRRFGMDVAGHHQFKAKELMREMFGGAAFRDLEFLPMDKGGTEYIEDMKIAQGYAVLNRLHMARLIIEEFFKQKHNDVEVIRSIHNYINFEDNVLRKGAISAHAGQRLVVPLNMRDGIIVGAGQGNASWNVSAPHGAGRVYSRRKAKAELSLEEFQKEMTGVWSSCIAKETLDESPMAYKNKQKIIDSIGDNVKIEFIMKPIYNFKATE